MPLIIYLYIMLIVSIFLHIHTDTQNVGSMKAGFFFPFACCYILNAYESVLCSSNLVRKYWMNKWINRWLNKGLSSNAMWWESRTSLPMAKWWIFTKARWSRKLNIWALQREGKTHKMWTDMLGFVFAVTTASSPDPETRNMVPHRPSLDPT